MLDDARLYDREYFRQYEHDPKREAMYLQEYARIAQRSDPGCVLDIGCGIGGFLAVFGPRWIRYGYEPSEYARQQAKSNGIYTVSSMKEIYNDTMDLVVFRGTLQHIAEPTKTLAESWRILKPGGMLVLLATPDADSLVYRLWGRLPALDPDRNWVVFGSRCLANILSRLGFVSIEIVKPYRGTPYARPLRDFCQLFVSLFLGWRPFAFPGNMIEIYAVKP